MLVNIGKYLVTSLLIVGLCGTKFPPTSRLLYVPRCSSPVCAGNRHALRVTSYAGTTWSTANLVGNLFLGGVSTLLKTCLICSELCCASGRLNSLASEEDITIPLPNLV